MTQFCVSYSQVVIFDRSVKLLTMGRIRLQKEELVWFGCFCIFLLPQTMLPSNDQIATQSCSFGQQKMATLLGVVEKYTRNRFQLSESVQLNYLAPTFPRTTPPARAPPAETPRIAFRSAIFLLRPSSPTPTLQLAKQEKRKNMMHDYVTSCTNGFSSGEIY